MAGSTVGTRVGPYTLVEEIGQGGFATVWLATDQEGNKVAIKRFAAEHGKEVDREKAANERACLERLKHPNVLTMLDAVADEAGVDSLVLEYCEAGDLIHKMTRVVNGGAKHESEAFHIWHQIVDGIGHMHERGVAHLDLKPQNVLLANEGAPCSIKVRVRAIIINPNPNPNPSPDPNPDPNPNPNRNPNQLCDFSHSFISSSAGALVPAAQVVGVRVRVS